MSKFKQFKVKDTGEVVTYPEHFENHPVFGLNIEPFDGECEVDKVVVADHDLPVEQRVSLYVQDDEEVEDMYNDEEENN